MIDYTMIDYTMIDYTVFGSFTDEESLLNWLSSVEGLAVSHAN